MRMISPEVNPNVPSGLQTTASTSNLWMMIANKQQQNQSLAENSAEVVFTSICFALSRGKISDYSTEKNKMVRDRKPRRAASAKQKDDWLLTPQTSSAVMSGMAWFLSS